MSFAQAASSAQAIRQKLDGLAAALARSRRPARAPAVACVLEIRGEGGGIWTVDLRTDPPRLQPGNTPRAECRIQIGGGDFLSLCQDPSLADFLVYTGRLTMVGASHSLFAVNQLLFGIREDSSHPNAGYYRALARLLPDQRFVFMNHGYDDGTEDFGDLRGEDMLWRYSIRLVRHVLGGLDLQGKRVLDVGCGRGGASSYIARYHQPAQVVSLDFCAEAVILCARTHRVPHLGFLQADAQKLPLAGGMFDVVLNIESCHYYPDLAGFLAEVARVLRPGGFLCLTDTMTPQQLIPFERALIPGAGFEIVRSQDITHEVAQGIDRNRQQLAQLCGSMVSQELGNRLILEQLLRSVNEDLYRGYLKRSAIYHSWLLRKPEAARPEP